ncbi:hypothetical protein PM8797T_19702 [Gimesia maris DSM 8797]|nr:hypothetical protein PM8797T_19702 [Gimesia maris DSM 8797]
MLIAFLNIIAEIGTAIRDKNKSTAISPGIDSKSPNEAI